MTNWTMMQRHNNELMSSFSPRIKKYLKMQDGIPSFDPARWLLDSFQLSEQKWPNFYGDYSFIVVPASKALESWIFQIAGELGISVSKIQVSEARNQIEQKLDEILNTVDVELKNSITSDITGLKSFIKEYRHKIVHCKQKIENPIMAKNKIRVIYEKINSVTEKLIDAGLIKI